jgi:protein TonB
MAAYAHDTQFFTRRIVVFFGIVVLHVLLVWALANGLARRVIESLPQNIETNIIEEIKKQDEPPPPPPPQMERPPVEVPPPDIAIDIPVEQSTTTAISDVTDKPVVRAPPPPTAAPTPAKLAKNFPNSEDYYPPSSKRNEEQGTPTVRVCVGPNGRLLSEPTIVAPSQFPKLDEAAIKLAKAGRYVAGTQNGQPMVESCVSFRVKFQLTN